MARPIDDQEHREWVVKKFNLEQRQKRWEMLLEEEKEERVKRRRVMVVSLLVFTIVVFTSMVVHSSRVKVESAPAVEGVTK